MNLFSRRRRRDYDYDDDDSLPPPATQHHGQGMTGNYQQGVHSGSQGLQHNDGFGRPNPTGNHHHQPGWTNTGPGGIGANNDQHNTGFAPATAAATTTTTGGSNHNLQSGSGFGHNTVGNNTVGHNDALGHGTVGNTTPGHHNAMGHNIGNQSNEPFPQHAAGINHNHHNRSNTGLNGTTGYNQPVNGSHLHNSHNSHYDDRYNDKHHDRHYKTKPRRRGGGGFLRRRDNHSRQRSRSSKPRRTREPFSIDNGTFNRRPTFGQWLKFIWLDLLTMAALGAVGLGVYNADPAPSRSFPVTFSQGSGDVVFPTIAYPLRNEIIPIWAAALMASLIPILIILVMQIRVKSFWDVNNAVLGLLYSLIAAAVFQVFLKWLIGGLRPHFLAVCDPDPALINAARGSGVVSGEQGNGYEGLMFDRKVCRGSRDAVNDALESFPSGHSTAAFAGFMFLYYYLNAKLKVWGNYHPAFWKLIATYAPVLGATLIAGAMTIDEYHHWYDVLAGGIIGTVMATSAYRMVYASIWDFRFNHIPLTRHTPFSFGAGVAGAGGFEAAVFTRQAGWGSEEAFGGAPFDAAYHLRGQVQGFNTQVHDKDGHEDGVVGHGHGANHGLGHEHETKHGLGHGHDNEYRRGDVEHHAATTATEPGLPHTRGHSSQRTLDPNVSDDRRLGHRGDGFHDHGADTTTRDEVLDHSDGNISGRDGSNRYRHHRKSMERKAITSEALAT